MRIVSRAAGQSARTFAPNPSRRVWRKNPPGWRGLGPPDRANPAHGATRPASDDHLGACIVGRPPETLNANSKTVDSDVLAVVLGRRVEIRRCPRIAGPVTPPNEVLKRAPPPPLIIVRPAGVGMESGIYGKPARELTRAPTVERVEQADQAPRRRLGLAHSWQRSPRRVDLESGRDGRNGRAMRGTCGEGKCAEQKECRRDESQWPRTIQRHTFAPNPPTSACDPPALGSRAARESKTAGTKNCSTPSSVAIRLAGDVARKTVQGKVQSARPGGSEDRANCSANAHSSSAGGGTRTRTPPQGDT